MLMMRSSVDNALLSQDCIPETYKHDDGIYLHIKGKIYIYSHLHFCNYIFYNGNANVENYNHKN